MVEYVTVPDGMDFSTEFPTWIIAFCPDTNSFFPTNQRFFFWQYETEFLDRESCIRYFEDNITEFTAYHKSIRGYCMDEFWLELPDNKVKKFTY